MIDSRELRIGNAVIVDGEENEILAIDSQNKCDIHTGSVTVWEIAGGHKICAKGRWCEKLLPIPITPEILESCGFNHVHLGGRSMIIKDDPYGTKSFTVTKNTDISGNYWCFIVTDFPPTGVKFGTDTIFINREIKYLHQLQNLYFALKGKELEIKM